MEDYDNVWKTAWNKYNGDVVRAISEVTSESKKWIHKTFSNIFHRKRLLQARISGIQKDEFYNNSGVFIIWNIEELRSLMGCWSKRNSCGTKNYGPYGSKMVIETPTSITSQ